MYILEVNHGGGEIHRHFLLPGQTYTLGRKECRILLPAAEPSISRHHATIVVASMPRYSVLDPQAQLEVRIEDMSKHGTFVDRERISKDNSRFLYPEDRIRLGLRVTARIIPMMLILAISPDLTDEHLDLVLDACVHIGALVVEDSIPAPLSYYEQHTNCIGFLYVAEDNFAMEETMMAALGYGYTLVTPQYIATLVRSLEERDTLMPGEFPSPSSPSPASMALRSVHYRRPAQTFFSVTEFLSIGRPIVATVFREYSFVLLDSVIEEAYGGVLRLFGGAVETIAMDAVESWHAKQTTPAPYPPTTVVLMGEGDFRTVSDEVIERGGGRGAFDTAHTRPIIGGYLALYRHGVCLIPEENVHLALYRNDPKELNTKATACYLQRAADLVSADTTPSPQPAAEPSPAAAPTHLRMGSGSGLLSDTSRRTTAARNAESSAATAPAPAPSTARAAPQTSAVVARRSREGALNSSGAGGVRSPPRAASTGSTAVSTAPALAAATTGSSGAAPAALAAQQDNTAASTAPANTAAAAPATVAAVLAAPAPTNGSAHASEASPSATVPASATPAAHVTPLAPAALSTPSGPAAPTCAAAGKEAVGSAELSPTATSAAEAAATSLPQPSPQSQSQSAQRISLNAAKRNRHPFSLTGRLRNALGESDEDDADDGAAPATVRQPVPGSNGIANSPSVSAARDGDDDHHHSNGGGCSSNSAEASQERRGSSLSSLRRASGSVRRASVGGLPTPTVVPLKSEEVVFARSRGASLSRSGTALGQSASALFEDRPPLAPHGAADDARRGSAMEEWRRRSSQGATADEATAPAPSAGASTEPRTLAASSACTSAVPVLQRAGSSKSFPPQPASAAPEVVLSKTPSHVSRIGSSTGAGSSSGTSSVIGAAATRAGEPAAQHPLSIRRGEQRLATASAPVPRRGIVRLHHSHDALRGPAEERSSSPSNPSVGRSRVERYATPERDVVVHTAAQVSKSPPRQRVEAVRINNALERRMSLAHEVEPSSMPRSSDAAEENGQQAGSMGNRRSVVRREFVSVTTRPPPLGASGLLSARRTSSSFQRSDSTQLREMATPHRIMTPRVSSSVPRNRRAEAYGSVQRHRSPMASCDTSTPNISVGDFSDSRAASASTSRASIRRRRGSPTQANGHGAAVPSAGLAVPGQIPGLRSGSSASVSVPASSVTAESYYRINEELCTHCQTFMSDFLDNFMTDTERTTRYVVRQTYMDAPSKQALEDGVERILEFLQYVNSTEPDIPAMYSTGGTRAACHQVRQKSQYALSKIKACYRTVGCKVPSALTRARAALSTRTVSPPSQRRLNTASSAGVAGAAAEAAMARRVSTF